MRKNIGKSSIDFSEYDAAIYQHIEEAYADADNGNYTMDEINRYIQDELNINFK